MTGESMWIRMRRFEQKARFRYFERTRLAPLIRGVNKLYHNVLICLRSDISKAMCVSKKSNLFVTRGYKMGIML